jgi:hypothetical protein
MSKTMIRPISPERRFAGYDGSPVTRRDARIRNGIETTCNGVPITEREEDIIIERTQ